jgi:hypothetical protein
MEDSKKHYQNTNTSNAEMTAAQINFLLQYLSMLNISWLQ